MRPLVYLDMDGVLTDLVGGCMKAHGWDAGRIKDTLDNWPLGEWSIAKVMGMDPIEWARPMQNVEFWESLEWSEYGFDLYNAIPDYFNVCILSSTGHWPASAQGKMLWLRKNLTRLYDEGRFVFCSQKERLARRGVWLIDDSDKNCEAFEMAGGRSLLWPQRWNRAYKWMPDKRVALDELLERFERDYTYMARISNYYLAPSQPTMDKVYFSG